MENGGYEILKIRIKKLKESFDFEQNEEDITEQQEDLIRAFRLLCYAEIESYIEDLATELLENSIEKWEQNKIANYNLASLFMWHDKIEKKMDVIQKANYIFKQYREIIKENHGIKEHNIRKLFTPLGYSIDDFDAVFISDITSWGGLRGEVAHSSARRTTTQLNLTDEIKKVDGIVNGLKDFQNKLNEVV